MLARLEALFLCFGLVAWRKEEEDEKGSWKEEYLACWTMNWTVVLILRPEFFVQQVKS